MLRRWYSIVKQDAKTCFSSTPTATRQALLDLSLLYLAVEGEVMGSYTLEVKSIVTHLRQVRASVLDKNVCDQIMHQIRQIHITSHV